MAASSSSSLGIMRRAAEMKFCPHLRGQSFLHLHRPPLLPMSPNYNQIVRRACLVSNLNNDCRAVENSVSEGKAIGNAKVSSPSPSPIDDDQKLQNQLDDWMSYSVSEIVRNIGKAPLLMHVYSNSKEDKEDENEERVESSSLASTTTPTTPPRIEREIDIVVGTESWSHIRRRWEEGSPIPDGVILVEQLDHYNSNNNKNNPPTKEDEEEEEEEEDQQQVIGEANYSCSNNNDNNKTTKTWGVLVQGRGTGSTPACYILKTCRVWSSLGFCTHFCLVRAKCFGEVAELQLNNSWLQQH